MNEDLLNLTKTAREQCLDELGYTNDNAKSAKNLLLGRCRSNSKQLKKVMEENGYEVEIGGGVLGPSIRREKIDSFQDAINKKEPIHYWIRVNGHICEIASESDQYYGEPMAARMHPEQLGYITFEDSYEQIGI